MRKRFILPIALITALLITGVTTAVLLQKTPEKPVYVAQEQKPLNADTIFELVNTERVKARLQPLIRDARLDATAQARADDMVARNYFSHYDPVSGESLVKIKPVVTDCVDASENIVQITSFVDKNTLAIARWINSKPHYDAMLNANYTITGVAVSGTIGVQHFCTR